MITGSTRVYALLGRPVHHSRSPALHNAWFATHGIDAVYVALEIPEGAEERALDAVQALGLAGANLTTPLKERAFARLADLDPSARVIGAVNLLVRAGDRLCGANTDAEGFCRSVEARGIALGGRIAAVIGTGGAARAVAAGLAARGAREIRLLGRRPEAAGEIARGIRGAFPHVTLDTAAITTRAITGADLIVVATSGRAAAVSALDPSVLAPGAAWVDLNYWDPDPPGFAAAARAGHTTIEGTGMLVWQAALSFERWIGVLPDVGTAGTRAR